MADKAKTVTITISEDQILEGYEYKPRSGKNGIRYQLAEDVQVTIKKVTPAVSLGYADLKPTEKDPDERLQLEIAMKQAAVVTEGYPEGFDWLTCSSKVLWRILEDFLDLSSPTLRAPK